MFVREGEGMLVCHPPSEVEGGGAPGQDFLKIFENCMRLRKSCSEKVGCQCLIIMTRIKKLSILFVCSMYNVAQHAYAQGFQVTSQARGGAICYSRTTDSIF